MTQSTKSIVRIKFQGPRFDRSSMPLGSLSELSKLQRILFEIARTQYLMEAAGKVRVPNNFYEKIALGVSRFDNGSKAPVLELEQPDSQVSFAGFKQSDLVNSTFNEFIYKLNQLSTKKPNKITVDFTQKELSLIKGFGSTLEDGERLILGKAKRNYRRIKLDKTTIEKIHETADSVFDTTIGVIGRIQSADINGRAEVKTVEHGHLDFDFKANGINIDLGPLLGSSIEATLLAQKDLSGSIKSIKKIISYDIPTEANKSSQLKFAERLISLLDLKSGWFEGEGVKPRGDAISAAYKVSSWLSTDYSKIPISPLIDGGINLTPRYSSWLLSIQVYNNSTIELSGYDKKTSKRFDEFVPFDKKGFSSKFIKLVGLNP